MKKYFLFCSILLIVCKLNAQGFDTSKIPSVNEKKLSFSVLKMAEPQLNVELLSITVNGFSFETHVRLEDEIPYTDTNHIAFNDFCFFDLGFSKVLKAFSVSIGVDNLLSFSKKSFEVSPVIEENDVINYVTFSYEPNFLLKASIAYNF